jgi:hypothetical protein
MARPWKEIRWIEAQYSCPFLAQGSLDMIGLHGSSKKEQLSYITTQQ